MKMRVVAYARYSSDNQREESIDAQLRAIRDYAKQNNMLIVKTYADRAMSGTKDNRPDFMQMIMDSRKGIFDAVIVHKLNKFSRNKYDAAKYKHKLQRNNVKLLSVLERLDDTPESTVMESLLIKIEKDIENILLAVAEGNRHASLMDRLSKLEEEKESLLIQMEETKLSYPETEPITASYLKKIFKEHKKILEERDKELIKKFISLYVEKVLVFEDYVDVVFKLSPLLVERSHGEAYHK